MLFLCDYDIQDRTRTSMAWLLIRAGKGRCVWGEGGEGGASSPCSSAPPGAETLPVPEAFDPSSSAAGAGGAGAWFGTATAPEKTRVIVGETRMRMASRTKRRLARSFSSHISFARTGSESALSLLPILTPSWKQQRRRVGAFVGWEQK